MKKVFLVLTVSLLSLTWATAQSKDDKQVADAVESLKKAMIDGTKADLEAITAAELSYGHSSGKLEDKNAFVTAISSGTSDFLTMDLSNQTISVVGNTALVRHNLNGTVKEGGGAPSNVKLGILLVWVKQKNDWKLLGRQAYKLP